MGYIENIRKYIEHEPIIVEAVMLVFNDKMELLFNFHTDTNTWGLPGRAMELYEDIYTTAIRELKRKQT